MSGPADYRTSTVDGAAGWAAAHAERYDDCDGPGDGDFADVPLDCAGCYGRVCDGCPLDEEEGTPCRPG